jgi:hypothetical protein
MQQIYYYSICTVVIGVMIAYQLKALHIVCPFINATNTNSMLSVPPKSPVLSPAICYISDVSGIRSARELITGL